jgi:uncharacterized membrane protein YheB (UPF0754 family)
MWHDWLTIPLIAALIGWFTNWVAVRMIFRPHEPKRILGFVVQGLLPKRRHEFADSIGATVADHLVSPDDVKRVLADPALSADVERIARAKIDDFLTQKVLAKNPMLGMVLKGPFFDGIKDGLVVECRALFADGLARVGEHLDERLDLKEIVVRKIHDFDIQKLEDIVVRVAKRELFWIEILGAVLGFIVGLLQVALLRIVR